MAAWGCGVVTILFILALNAYPLVDVKSPGLLAAKILGTVAVVNAFGYGFYNVRRKR